MLFSMPRGPSYTTTDGEEKTNDGKMETCFFWVENREVLKNRGEDPLKFLNLGKNRLI